MPVVRSADVQSAARAEHFGLSLQPIAKRTLASAIFVVRRSMKRRRVTVDLTSVQDAHGTQYETTGPSENRETQVCSAIERLPGVGHAVAWIVVSDGSDLRASMTFREEVLPWPIPRQHADVMRLITNSA